jgi:hypothetical protein
MRGVARGLSINLPFVLVLNPMAWFRGRGRARGRLGSWSPCMARSGRRLSMNRTMPGLQMNKLRILGSWSQCIRKNERGLSMNLRAGQAFQPAGLRDFPVPWTKNGRLESRSNPQAGKPALRTSPGSWSPCMRKMKEGSQRWLVKGCCRSRKIGARMPTSARTSLRFRSTRGCGHPRS